MIFTEVSANPAKAANYSEQPSNISEISSFSKGIPHNQKFLFDVQEAEIEHLLDKVGLFYSWSQEDIAEFRNGDPKGLLVCLRALKQEIELLDFLGLRWEGVPQFFESLIKSYCHLKHYAPAVENGFLEPLRWMSPVAMLHEIVDFQKTLRRLDSS